MSALPDAPQYGRCFTAWRDASAGTWHDCTTYVLVEGLREGTLSRAAFLTCLMQDYPFLLHFSRDWGLWVVKAATLDEMRACLATVHPLVDGEMALHLDVCASERIDAAAREAAEESPENLAYTHFVLEAGYSGDFLTLLAVLAPCVVSRATRLEVSLRGQDRA